MVHIASSGYHRTSAMETQCGGYGVLQRCRVVCIEMEMNLTMQSMLSNYTANTGAKSAITAPTPLPRCVRSRLRDMLLAVFFTEK